MDQVFVPKTRSSHPAGLPPLDPEKDDILGAPSRVSETVQGELWDAIGDSPIAATVGMMNQLVSVHRASQLSVDQSVMGLNSFLDSPPT
jgi:hypothetical protein